MKSIVLSTLMLVLVIVLTGCASKKEVSVTLNGKVTTPSGPLKNGVVNFLSRETGQAISANVTDGQFEAKGQIPEGKYVVFFTAPLPSDPLPGKPPAVVKLTEVPEKYRNEATSPLTADILAGTESLDLTIAP